MQKPNHVVPPLCGLIGLAMITLADVAPAHPGHGEDAGADLTPGFFLAQGEPPPFGGGDPRQFRGRAPTQAAESPLKNQVSITVEGDYRMIRSNGIADHPTGQFPNRGNPNSISAQDYHYRVPVHPVAAAALTRLAMQPFGVAVNGVVFDPGAAEWWNNDRSSGWQIEPLTSGMLLGMDQNNAHVQPNGAYHYHAIPTGLVQRLTGGSPRIALVGWAADGFPIYGPWDYADAKSSSSPLKKLASSYRVKKGARTTGPGGAYDGAYGADWEYVAGSGDLDECNGRFGVTPEFPAGTYHYVLTESWPFIPRYFHGTPDSSFERHGPPGGFRGPGGPGGPGFPGGRRPPGPPPGGPGFGGF